jgi:redox-sensitive bicupin YhaK (pirin superfamily)
VGVSVNRLFPIAGKANHDPFVLWDHFNVPASAGFPDHPHRGFEAITYIMQGSMQHTDNLGNSSTVTPGGLQRFTAGKGIVHSEMPSADGATRGIQLWINLPRRLKQIDPAYQQVDADAVPVYPIDGGEVRELVGEHSPLQLKTAVRYLDVKLQAGHCFSDAMPQDFRGLVYVIDGEISAVADEQKISVSAGNSLLYEAGSELNIQAETDSRILLCFGRPHNEPVYQHGTYVD